VINRLRPTGDVVHFRKRLKVPIYSRPPSVLRRKKTLHRTLKFSSVLPAGRAVWEAVGRLPMALFEITR
jgi:hypothetical protein